MNKKLIPTILIAIFAISILATAFPTQTAAAATTGTLEVSTIRFFDFAVIRVAVKDPDGIAGDTWTLKKDGTTLIANLTKYAIKNTKGEYVVYLAANTSNNKKTALYPLQYKLAYAIEDAKSTLKDAWKYAKIFSNAIKAIQLNATAFLNGPAYTHAFVDVDSDGVDDYVAYGAYAGYNITLIDLYADYAANENFDLADILAHPEKADIIIYMNVSEKSPFYDDDDCFFWFPIDVDPDSNPTVDECDYNVTLANVTVAGKRTEYSCLLYTSPSPRDRG